MDFIFAKVIRAKSSDFAVLFVANAFQAQPILWRIIKKREG